MEHIAVWQQRRNDKQIKANWKFTNKQERIKLCKFYPFLLSLFAALDVKGSKCL
jgi:hypothetical protein